MNLVVLDLVLQGPLLALALHRGEVFPCGYLPVEAGKATVSSTVSGSVQMTK